MKTRILSYAVLCLLSACATVDAAKVDSDKPTPSTADASKLDSEQQKLSYAFGYNVGQKIRTEIPQLDETAFGQALHDAMTEKASRLSDAETQAVVASYQKKRQEEVAKRAETNLKAGQEFLAANKKKKDVVTLPSGLQYKIIKSAKGDKPTASDSVVAHYRGTLIDGKEFDSSIKRGEPATFPVNGVIPGWQQALPLMPVGSKWQVFIPAELAYGAHGSGGSIGPNETLIFEIELLKIEKAK
jgi:FKBP-type peptidyl-prolyl cis-trans isomerase FklB